jgi:hypothetical protein
VHAKYAGARDHGRLPKSRALLTRDSFTRSSSPNQESCKPKLSTNTTNTRLYSHRTMSVNPTRRERLATGFMEDNLQCVIEARRRILETSTKEELVIKAVTRARKQKWCKTKPRGLWYLLHDIFRKEKDSEKCIFDTIDPWWPLLPDPRELRDDSGALEIQGHLLLIKASFECWTKVFSIDKNTTSEFLLFAKPFAYSRDTEKYNWGSSDFSNFRTFSYFWKAPWQVDHGLTQTTARDRFGFFVTKTETWVRKGKKWHETPHHAWVAWLSKMSRATSFQLIIFDPNNTALPRTTVHKSALCDTQRVFIEGCLATWKTLTKDRLFLACSEDGNPDRRCMELSSR